MLSTQFSPLSRGVLLASILVSSAFANPCPQETGTPTTTQGSDSSTITAPATTSIVTTAPGLTCTDGSSVITTERCTIGGITSYCYKTPTTTCPPGYFPGLYHPGHCIEAATCYDVNSPWLTPYCSNGATAYSTSTLFTGTLSGETTATTITNVQCACSTQDFYSYYNDGATGRWYCLPKTDCPEPMTTSYSTNEFCQTADTATYTYCSTLKEPDPFCKCDAGSTAVYPETTGAEATGCAAVATPTA